MRVKIRGKVWDLRFSEEGLEPNTDGVCDAPTKKGKRVVVRPDLPPKRELEIIIHELTHAGLWDLDEEVVEEFASDLQRVLWTLGYRRVPL